MKVRPLWPKEVANEADELIWDSNAVLHAQNKKKYTSKDSKYLMQRYVNKEVYICSTI